MLCIVFIIQLIYAIFCLYALRGDYFFRCPPAREPAASIPRGQIALNMITVFALSFALRAYFLLTQTNGDVKYYISAVTNLTDGGFFGYYDRAKIVYPPFFNYTYYLLGDLMRLLRIPLTDAAQLPLLFLKLPATVCDYLTALFLYRIGARRDYRLGFALCCLYVLNPAAIFDSAYVGQVDSIYGLFVVLTVYYAAKRRCDLGCFFFAAGFLFKYQTVFIFPVLLCGLVSEVFFEDFTWKKLWRYLTSGVLSLALVFAAYLPFIWDPAGGHFLPGLISGTVRASVAGYGRCSTNAYNLWTLLGCNLKPASTPYLFLTAGTWGSIHIALLTCGCLVLFWKMRRTNSAAYPLLGAWLITGVFCFSVKMMCRYLFPAIALLYMAYAMHPSRRLRRLVFLFSVLYIPVIMLPLTCYGYEQYHDGLIVPRVLSAGMIVGFLYLSAEIVGFCRFFAV